MSLWSLVASQGSDAAPRSVDFTVNRGSSCTTRCKLSIMKLLSVEQDDVTRIEGSEKSHKVAKADSESPSYYISSHI